MDPKHLFVDERLTGGPPPGDKPWSMCAYCGSQQPETRDHVPSKVLLDRPYPEQLPTVGACESCNASFSLDEQYLACLVDCVVGGTVETSGLSRKKVERILAESPELKARLAGSIRRPHEGTVTWDVEQDRVRNVVLKLARGHGAYELYPQLDPPSQVGFAPLETLTAYQRSEFEGAAESGARHWPEIGSRGFLRASGKSPDGLAVEPGGWVYVQPDRYRFAAVESDSGISVRVVLSEYLAAQVVWRKEGRR